MALPDVRTPTEDTVEDNTGDSNMEGVGSTHEQLADITWVKIIVDARVADRGPLVVFVRTLQADVRREKEEGLTHTTFDTFFKWRMYL